MMNRGVQIKKLLEEHPDDIFLIYAWGMECLSVGDTEAAREQFRKILNIDPHHHDAMFRLAQMEEQTGNEGNAVYWYEKARDAARKNGAEKTVREIDNILENLKS